MISFISSLYIDIMFGRHDLPISRNK